MREGDRVRRQNYQPHEGVVTRLCAIKGPYGSVTIAQVRWGKQKRSYGAYAPKLEVLPERRQE